MKTKHMFCILYCMWTFFLHTRKMQHLSPIPLMSMLSSIHSLFMDRINILCLCSYASCHGHSILGTWSTMWTLLLKQTKEYLSSSSLDVTVLTLWVRPSVTVKIAAWNVTLCCLIDQCWCSVGTCCVVDQCWCSVGICCVVDQCWCSMGTCCVVDQCWCSIGTCCLCIRNYCTTSAFIYHTSWCHIPKVLFCWEKHTSRNGMNVINVDLRRLLMINTLAVGDASNWQFLYLVRIWVC